MKNKLNILITTVGGMTSPDILRAYKDCDEFEINLIGVDAFEFAVGKKFVDIFELSPNSVVNEKLFVEFIQEMVKKYKVDVVIPCGNEDNLALSKYSELVSCKIMVSSYDSLIKAYDKGTVYKELTEHIPEHAPRYEIVNNYEQFMISIKKLGYPNNKVVIKPRFGRGGRGVYILCNKFNFQNVFESKPITEYPLEFFEKILRDENKFDDLIIMEYLDEPYYSVYSISNNGENIFSLNHIREWGNASQTFRGRVCYDVKIENLAAKIIEKFNLSYTNNIELATSSDGRIVLFDLNPRIGASSGIDKDIGFNFPLEALKLLLGSNITVDKSKFEKPKIFLRYFDQVWDHND